MCNIWLYIHVYKKKEDGRGKKRDTKREWRREGEKESKEGEQERKKGRINHVFVFVCLFVFVSNVLLYILLFHIYIFSDVCDYVANRKLMTCLLYQIRRLERGKAAIMQTQAQFE